MKYVAAYMLCVMGGKKSPTAKDIENVLSSVGIQAEADKMKKVLELLNGKDIDQLMAEGQEKLACIPSGGGVAAAAAPAEEAAPAQKEEKKEEKEESEDEFEGGMGGLFD